ncbi:outer envelope protein 61-like [Chenopodium quinoa]|uniref:outer envelope protein 61-like n=1 Tax=Chenopodium quinoa TaxID=63459 RepID=UPI000B7705F9|nr:outer envelope protein 61-like [Chenopodium quinoa]
MDCRELLSALTHMHLNDNFDESIVNFAKNNCPRNILNQAKDLKEEGNTYFKKGEIVLVRAKYDRGLKLMCFCLPRNEDDCVFLWNIAIYLESNLTACALEVRDFEQTKELCSLVIMLDGNNTIALYRRAVAEIKLYQLEEAHEDLSKAAKTEPKNQDILREMEKVEGLRIKANKIKGKRGIEESDLSHTIFNKKGKINNPSVSLDSIGFPSSDAQSDITALPTKDTANEMMVDSLITTSNVLTPLEKEDDDATRSPINQDSGYAKDKGPRKLHTFLNGSRSNQSLKISDLSYSDLC